MRKNTLCYLIYAIIIVLILCIFFLHYTQQKENFTLPEFTKCLKLKNKAVKKIYKCIFGDCKSDTMDQTILNILHDCKVDGKQLVDCIFQQ